MTSSPETQLASETITNKDEKLLGVVGEGLSPDVDPYIDAAKDSEEEAEEKKVDPNYHDPYIRYINTREGGNVKDGSGRKIKGLHAGDYIPPDLTAGAHKEENVEEYVSNWFDADGGLKEGVLDTVLFQDETSGLIVLKAKYNIPLLEAQRTGSQMLTVLKNPAHVDYNAVIDWVKKLEFYIWNEYEKAGSMNERAKGETRQFGIEMDEEQENVVESLLVGGWEDLKSMEPGRVIPVVFLLFGAWKANKAMGGKLLTALGIAGAAYGADVLQAKYTDLNGGEMVMNDLLGQGHSNEYRHTPAGAMLHAMSKEYDATGINLQDPEYVRASLLLGGATIQESLGFLREIENAGEIEPIPKKGVALETLQKYPGLKKVYNGLLDKKRGTAEEEETSANAIYHVLRAFALYTGKRVKIYGEETRHNASTNVSRGINYLSVRHLNKTPDELGVQNTKEAEYYENIRTRLWGDNQQPGDNILMASVFEREVPLEDIQKSVDDNKTNLDKLIEWLEKKYNNLSPKVKDFFEKGYKQYGEPFLDWMKDEALPWVKTSAGMALGWAGTTIEDTYLNFMIWYKAKGENLLKTTGEYAWAGVKLPFQFVGKTAELTIEGAKTALEKMRQFKDNYLKPWLEYGKEKDPITLDTAENFYKEIFGEDERFKKAVVHAYGLVPQDELPEGSTYQDSALYKMCVRLFEEDRGTKHIVKILNQFRKADNLRKSYDKEKRHGTIDLTRNKEKIVTKGEIKDMLFMNSYGLMALADGTYAAAAGLENAGIDAGQVLVNIGSILPRIAENILWKFGIGDGETLENLSDDIVNGMGMLRLPQNVNMRGAHQMKAIHDLMMSNETSHLTNDNMIWSKEKLEELVEYILLNKYTSLSPEEKRKYSRMIVQDKEFRKLILNGMEDTSIPNTWDLVRWKNTFILNIQTNAEFDGITDAEKWSYESVKKKIGQFIVAKIDVDT